MAITQNQSGRPNFESLTHETFRQFSVDRHGNVIGDTQRTLKMKQKRFFHKSVSSPRANGKLIIKSNPYEREKIDASHGVVQTYVFHKFYGYGYSYANLDLGSWLPGSITDERDAAVSRARTKFLADVRNASANLLLALVERKEIIETVLTLTWRAYGKLKEYKKLLERYNRLKKDEAKRNLIKSRISGFSARGLSNSKDSVADLWLFYVYALMPLVLEAKQALEHIKKISPRAVHGRGKESFDYTYSFTSSYFKGVRDYHGFVSCHARGYVTVVDPFEKFISEWGFTNIATIVWERITYSFIWDWFFNIGGYLQALSSLDGVVVTDYNETVTYRNGMTLNNFESITAGGYDTVDSTLQNAHFFSYEKKERGVYGKPPMPLILADANITWQRLLSGLSLLNQRMLKIR